MVDIPNFVMRTCSYDESFEQILPDHWQPDTCDISLNSDEESASTNLSGPPLDREKFEKFFDNEGRLVDEPWF